MGIRVHKVIGYGMRGFVAPKGFAHKRSQLGEMSRQQFNQWVAKHRKEIEGVLHGTAPPPPGKYFDLDIALMGEEETTTFWVSYNPEFGFEDALLITPPTASKDWRRYDDSIDYIEEHDAEGPKVRWEWVERSLYPHEKGKTPASVAAVCLYLGIPEAFYKLKEALYVWWC